MAITDIANSTPVTEIKNFVKTNFTDKSAENFSELLKNNFSAIDENRDNNLSSAEIANSLKDSKLDNISELITKLDLNGDGGVSLAELDKKNNLSKTITEAVSGIMSDKSSSEILSKAVGKIGKIYHLNDIAQKTLNSVVDKIV